MLGLIFFVLFTPGASEFICTSSDLEMSYTFCDSTAHVFMFNVTPCNIMNKTPWKAALTWIPRSDITFLKTVFQVWYDSAKALHWKRVLCSGADDKYAVCGALKGETLVSAFDIKGFRSEFPKGNYTVVVQGFSDDYEKNMIICLNFTMIVKQDVF
ncbi:PREDICTED: lymphocyte antigen 96 [Acanthisitta chloris]|uniref:Lymphocyte antigen 96 n=1 Tax=Acanthisitta chloris TaxID=57068 RepID=A0A091MCA4_9PASS|nr:PREDICTED: lymphocyte antigen 96 [Acanthisitta chloris]KFP71747.1 Lymphocyte antigen 96 [Acanthisitta chloris]